MSWEAGEGRRVVLAALGLFLGTLLLYAGVRELGFLDYDDGIYLRRNEHVVSGVTPRGLWWALTSVTYACNWHPATWASHMLDMSLFAKDPAGHHLHSAVLHAANAVLCFFALRALTGAFWRSLVVAALFACHPLRVESVAWISERKDVLSGFWSLATLWLWASWVRSPTRARHVLVAAALTLALLAKPMAVTLPFLLVLLDRWPLGRRQGWPELLREKLLLFVLAAGSAVLTLVAQSRGGCTGFVEEGIAAGSRLGNAAIATWQYVGHTLWPARLSVFYPHPAVVEPETSRALASALAAGALLVTSALAAALRRRSPALLVGWLWFLGMLVPVLGVVQVGGQALADRYAYLSTVGLYVAAVWCLGPLARRPALRASLAGLALVAVGFLSAATLRQIPVWKDDRTLFEHALRVTERNYVAHTNLGRLAGFERSTDRTREAREHFEAAVSFAPGFFESRLNLGLALRILGEPERALDHLERAVRIRPERATGHYELALALQALGRLDEAERELLEARRLEPDHPHVDRRLLELRRARDAGREGGERGGE